MKKSFLFDCHAHSNYSDGEMTVEQVCATAYKNGLAGIALTDHFEFDYPNPLSRVTFDPVKRQKDVYKQQKLWQDKLVVLDGVEMGVQPTTVERAQKFVAAYPYDFVLCSIHVADAMSISGKVFFTKYSQQQGYKRYLEEVYRIISVFKDYDSLAHLGYIRRYGDFQDRSMSYKDYADLYDAILKVLVAEGKGLEINTAGLALKPSLTTLPDFDVVARFKELGGTIITLGSDSHNPESIGVGFDEVVEQLIKIGFSSVTNFKQRKPYSIPLL